MRHWAVAASAAAWLAVLVATPPAHADRLHAEAERRNRNGNRHYAAGRFDSALQSYQSAYDLTANAKYLYNIGLAKEKLFDYEGCALAFGKFLRQREHHGDADVRSSATRRRNACLERTTVPVRVTSAPSNSRVRIDDVARGRTPQVLMARPGRHRVTVSAAGYVDQTQTLDVAVGQRPQLDFVLEKLSSLRIEVDPAGARVRIDDGAWTSAPAKRQLRAGMHDVVVEKAGHASVRRQVNVQPGQEVSLVLSLRQLPAVRRLRVRERTGAPGAVVEIDGRPRGRPPLAVTLSPGAHRIRVVASRRLPYASAITIPDDRDVLLTVRLQPQRSRANRYAFWGLSGSAAAAGVVGTIYGTLALMDQRAFHDDPTSAALHVSGERRARNADLWLGTAAVLGVGAIVWHYATRPPRSTARASY